MKNLNMMKKLLLLLVCGIAMVACHENLEQRAARQAKEFTQKNCPSAIKDNVRTDSMTYDEATRTLIYSYTLFNELDDSANIKAQEQKLVEGLQKRLIQDISTKTYKDAGFNFRYVYHSNEKPQLILLDTTFTPEEYQ